MLFTPELLIIGLNESLDRRRTALKIVTDIGRERFVIEELTKDVAFLEGAIQYIKNKEGLDEGTERDDVNRPTTESTEPAESSNPPRGVIYEE